jgi:hypothetical protein
MLLCSRNSRHFRGFINDREYVNQLITGLEGAQGRGTPENRVSQIPL